MMDPATPEPASGIPSFLVRLAFVIAVFAVPILGTSYYFVAQVSADVARVRSERASLDAYERLALLYPALERLLRARADGDRVAEAAARDRVARATASMVAGYRARTLDAGSRVDLQTWASRSTRLLRAPTRANVDATLESLRALGAELEGDSPLDFDPSSAIQNLSAAILRQKPRAFVLTRRTVDAVVEPIGSRSSLASLEAIATGRALLAQPVELAHGDVETAIALEPGLAPIARLEREADRTTRAVQRRLDAIVRRQRTGAGDAASIERAGRAALDAQDAVWRLARASVTELVDRQNDDFVAKRYAIVAISFAAVLVGTLGVVAIGRYMRRSDGIQLAAARAEGERLRAELARVSVERALRLQEAQFRTVFESAELGIAIFDERGDVVQRNPALARMLATTSEIDLAREADAFAFFRRPPSKPYTVERCVDEDVERPTWLALTFSGVYDDDVCKLVVLLARDATEEKTLQRRLMHDATHDPLTHLANRAAFERALHEHVAGERSGEAFAVMYVDLDSFKVVNDTHGHAAGDRVLCVTAQRLVAAVASTDLCARLGGDEFALILRGVDDRARLASIASRINGALAMPVAFGAIELAVAASIGIARGSVAYASIDRLVHDADLALYAVKARGRNGYAFGDDLARASVAARSAR